MIKYRDDCPHEDLKNTYYQGQRRKNPTSESYIIYETMKSAKHSLKFIPMGKYAKIVEFDLYPRREFVPTEHFFLTQTQINRAKMFIPPEKGI